MKKALLLICIGTILVSICLAGHSCGTRSRAGGPDTLKINTTEIGADIIGFNGPTPVEISVVQGVITKIVLLPNLDDPRYLKMVEESGLYKKLVGKTLSEAKQVELDAVSGATYSSTAIIENIRLGIGE